MKIKNQYQETIPEFWLPYLINGDMDDYTPDELHEMSEFENNLLKECTHFVIDYDFCEDNTPYFGRFNGIGHTLRDVNIVLF